MALARVEVVPIAVRFKTGEDGGDVSGVALTGFRLGELELGSGRACICEP